LSSGSGAVSKDGAAPLDLFVFILIHTSLPKIIPGFRCAAKMAEVVDYEIEALKAIYGSDFEERPNVWNNISFSLKIRPISFEGKDIYVQ
jgi:hypothetical protein